MMAAKFYYYTVEGQTIFPIDMLRYDCAWPYDNDAVVEMCDAMDSEARRDRMFQARHGQPEKTTYRITLHSINKPEVARWKSFLWNVTEIIDPRGTRLK